jgi:hypothetical protein
VCVVWDAHERFGGNPMADEEVKIDPGEPSRVFGHFVRAADRLAMDPRRLPLDLLVYIVDTHLTQPEMEWANRYGSRPNVAAAFFRVPFREGVNYERRAATAPRRWRGGRRWMMISTRNRTSCRTFCVAAAACTKRRTSRRKWRGERHSRGGVCQHGGKPVAAWTGFPAISAAADSGMRPARGTRSTFRGSALRRTRRRMNGEVKQS